MAPTVQTVSVFLAILAAAIILLVGLMTTLLREGNDKATAYSFSRFQLYLWTLTIMPLFGLHWGYKYFPDPDHEHMIDRTALILLSISSAVTLTASVINAIHLSNKNSFKSSQVLKLERQSQGFWIDILTDDEGQFSVARLQQLVFTLIYVVIYVTTFFAKDKALPVFDDYAFILMGISTGSYVVAKSMYK